MRWLSSCFGTFAKTDQEPSAQVQFAPFYTATQPLEVWLDKDNICYQLKGYQRAYEWGVVQVEG